MSAEKREALGQLEDAIAALVAERHGPGRLLGAWEVMVETIDPDRPDVTSWMDDGGGSMRARRGLIEAVRDMYRESVEEPTDDE